MLALLLLALQVALPVSQTRPEKGLSPALSPGLSPDSVSFVRVNQVGYLSEAPKVAVVCSLQPVTLSSFIVEDTLGTVVQSSRPAPRTSAFGPCVVTHRLDFSLLREPGSYRVVALTSDGARISSSVVRVGSDVWRGGADTLLMYMRQQRSGYNPFFRDSVHRYDGIVVDGPRRGAFRPTSGGWADAADYLQYVTTSATATYSLLLAYRERPASFADTYDALGLPGRNRIPDVLDEARHGLEWLLRMFPSDDELYNQLGDDRDHSFLDLPTTDSSDYGWGRGKERALYPCTGKPQGLFNHRNRSDGMASTAGKYASAFALAARLFASRDSAFAARLRERAAAAYAIGRRSPGVCQTAPGVAPYFYEEDNWHDDMELAAAELHALTADMDLLEHAVSYARRERVTPWMGADTAKHYQWYPWFNAGHFALWSAGRAPEKRLAATMYREGLERIARRAAANGFRVGIPFIWCSSNLMSAVATQAYLYRRMTGDEQFREVEQAALDWLFGANPWGVSMIIGYPRAGRWARDPHSVVAMQLGPETQTGGMLDGPVYQSIYRNLRGIRLHQPDEFAAFNTAHIVYHDDRGDYSTNEPIMDGTANLIPLLAMLAGKP
jgi:endoglucanase